MLTCIRKRQAILKNKNQHLTGFSIVELILIIVIVGILATIAYVSYGNAQARARDVSVQSDIEAVDTAETNYMIFNNSTARAWYSGDGIDTDLNFTPSDGNVIDIVVDGSEYCIRGYNLNGTKNSIFNAFFKESNIGVCDGTEPGGVYPDGIEPSLQAIADYSGPKLWMKISVGTGHTCAIASDNNAYCWGGNLSGELGDNSTTQRLVPVAVYTSGLLSGKTIKSMSSGNSFHTCAIASDNNAYCWGGNLSGQLGNNSIINRSVPVAVDTSGLLSGKTIKSISGGYHHTCAIASDNNAYCWGGNASGQLGNNSIINRSVPVAVDTSGLLSGKTIKSISSGNIHTCAIASDNNAYCWGSNLNGKLGNNSTTNSRVPVAVDTSGVLSGKTIKSISSGNFHTCVIASDNKTYCWGGNISGQLGNNSTTNSSVPVAVYNSGVLSGKTIKSISKENSFHTCVIASDYNTYCWGSNDLGQLGNNSTTNSSVPVAVNAAP